MRNSLRALSLLAAPALVLGLATPASASTTAASAQLASTGAQVTGWIIAAIVFLGLGALLFFIAQRRRVKARTDEAALTAALESAEAAEASTPAEAGLGEAAADVTATASDAAGAVATAPAATEAAPSESASAAEESGSAGSASDEDGEPRSGNTPA